MRFVRICNEVSYVKLWIWGVCSLISSSFEDED